MQGDDQVPQVAPNRVKEHVQVCQVLGIDERWHLKRGPLLALDLQQP